MDVILLEKVGRMGVLGDRISVKPGFGRNFLIPQGKAVLATPDNVQHYAQRRAELEKAAQEKLDAALARAEQVAATRLTLSAKAGDEGRLFGSIGTRDIAEAAQAAGLDLTKSELRLPNGPIRAVGEYSIAAQLHSEVIAQLSLTVVAEAP